MLPSGSDTEDPGRSPPPITYTSALSRIALVVQEPTSVRTGKSVQRSTIQKCCSVLDVIRPQSSDNGLLSA